MDLSTCIKVAPLLRVSHFWLYDESHDIDDSVVKTPSPLRGKAKASPAQAALAELAAAMEAAPLDAATEKLLADELKLKAGWLRAVKK